MKRTRLVMAGLVAAALSAGPVAYALGAYRSSSADDLALIGGVMQLVERVYVHPVGSDELTKDALKGMLGRLDPHSDYMTEQEYRQSRADIAGKFGGLGIEITRQNGGLPTVVSPIDGTPAARSGIQAGDLILAIDGESTHGLDLGRIVGILRGKPGTSVKLTISRGKQPPFDVSITRAVINVQTVKSKLEADGVGYVRISEFAENTARDFKDAVEQMKQQAGGSLAGLVLDLRNDPGGLLTAAVAVAGDFLDGGTVVTIRGRDSRDNRAYQAPATGDLVRDTPVVVLINGASASASEIVAGALKDLGRATVMGTQSFGKGSVQTIIPIKGHGALRLTTALYYTPNGKSIQGRGIAPDVVVEAPKDEQAAQAMIVRESTLSGAFPNPGTLARTNKQKTEKTGAADATAAYSPPIRTELIGSPDDAQLNAALSFLSRSRMTMRNHP